MNPSPAHGYDHSFSEYLLGDNTVPKLACSEKRRKKPSCNHENDAHVNQKLAECLTNGTVNVTFTNGQVESLHDLYLNRRLTPTLRVPRAIAHASNTQDVVTAIQCAKISGALPVIARGGGHSNLACGVDNPGGVVVNLEQLQEYTPVDEEALEVWLGPGMRVGGAYARLFEKGRYLSGGFEAGPSVGGLVLGGGRGPMSHKEGLLIDHLMEVELVDAQGQVLMANTTHHSDLFWALRGAGHNQFGIVTRLRLRTIPADKVTRFSIRFKREHYLDLWRVVNDGKREATNYVTLVVERQKAGDLWVGLKGQVYREIKSDEELFESLGIQHLKAKRVKLKYMTVLEASAIWSGLGSRPEMVENVEEYTEKRGFLRGMHWNYLAGFASNLTGEIMSEAIQALESYPYPGVPGDLVWSFEVARFAGPDSAVSKVASNATAFPHRQSKFYTSFGPKWYNASLTPAITKWYEAVAARLHRTTTDGFYAQYTTETPPRGKSLAQAYYAENLEKLSFVKTLYDPTGVFSYSQTIPHLKCPPATSYMELEKLLVPLGVMASLMAFLLLPLFARGSTNPTKNLSIMTHDDVKKKQ